MAEAGLGWKIGYGFLVTFILVTVSVLGAGEIQHVIFTIF